MRLKYLGTAAAEGVPSAFCNCSVCKEARKLGGKNIRARSQVLIDNDLLVDFGADTYSSSVKYGVDLSEIKYFLITHTHSDHYIPMYFNMRGAVYAHDMKIKDVYLCGNSEVERKFWLFHENNLPEEISKNIHFVLLKAFERTKLGDNYVTPLKADHAKNEDAFVYVIEKNGKVMLYCNDTGILPQEDLDYLKNLNVKFDYLNLDCTHGVIEETWGNHMSMKDDKILFDKLKELNVLKKDTKVCVTHFSHNHIVNHNKMKKLAQKYGFTVAYDGMEVNI